MERKKNHHLQILGLGAGLVLLLVVTGLVVGLAIGLWTGWIAWPAKVTNVDIADLNEEAQNDYIVLIAKTFEYDQDLPSARERLEQLKDPRALDRVASLALSFKSENRPEAATLASFAIALGVRNQTIALIAKTATPLSQATASPTSTQVPSSTPTLQLTSTSTPTPTTATRTATRRPTATATNRPNPVIPTALFPGSLSDWPSGFKIEYVNVAPGQQYWHIVKGTFCDYAETLYGCSDKSGPPTLPGGQGTIGVWVKLLDGKAPLILDDKTATLEDKSSDTQCQCTYTLDFPGPTIQVANFPSDRVIGAANKSAKIGFPNTHVRYFFTYQLVTR